MLFNSYVFLLAFLPATLIGCFLIAHRHSGAAALWLGVASVLFYAWWSPKYAMLLVGSIFVNFAFGRAIVVLRAQGMIRATKLMLTGVVVANLLVLGYFKYVNFFLDTISPLFNAEAHFAKVILPLGISFFTFTQIAFLVDAFRGKATEPSLIHYFLFVSYFPHQIAGPILHHAEMMPQFRASNAFRFRLDNLTVGMMIFVVGLVKKIVLADGLAPFANRVFESAGAGASIGFLEGWSGALAYSLQLYFDFSGYCDMAIGTSKMLGILLPVNFASPYRSKSIIEFWRRWHITLSRFLRDYLYFPLGGNRLGMVRRFENLFVTMLLGGLWHGAGWTFVFWGGLHGVYLSVNHLWRSLRGKPKRSPLYAGFGDAGCWILTMICVVVAWVFFRADSMATALTIVGSMAGLGDWVLPVALQGSLAKWMPGARFSDNALGSFGSAVGILLIAFAACLAVAGPNTQQLMRQYRPALETLEDQASDRRILAWRPSIPWALAAGIVAAFCFTRLGAPSEFLYFNF